jgi:hypothetical protein
MIYRAIGVMSGSSLDGLDIAFAEFHENAGNWSYEIREAECYSYSGIWIEKIKIGYFLEECRLSITSRGIRSLYRWSNK